MMQELEHAPCLYFCTTDDGILLEVNETLCSRLGYSKDELTGKKAEILFTIATRIFQQTHLFPLLKLQQHAEEIFLTLQTKSKKGIPVLLNAERKIMNDVPVNVYIGIVVNNRKKFEDELIDAKKTAETALRENTALNQAKQQLQLYVEQLDEQMQLVKKQNEELQQFNHTITHDLQEPLRKLSVFADMIFQTNNKKDQQEITGKLMRVLKQMRSIMSGLQQYIWLTGNLNKLIDVDLNEIIVSACKQLKDDFPGINLDIQKHNLPTVFADKEQMQLLFYHLLSNTVRFRKPGNDVNVTISANKLLMNKFRNLKDKYKYTDFFKIELTDEGIGFNIEYKEQVFELFKRLHTESGYGIGLALCKKIIETHQGNISINSKENIGTTITILLPHNATQKN